VATESFRAGPSEVGISKQGTISLPALSSLAFTASGTSLTDSVFNSSQGQLDTTLTYQVCLAALGEDGTTSGYSIGSASPSSGNLTLTTGQVIKVSVALGAWPANYQYGYIAIFLKQGNGDFQMAGIFEPSTTGISEAVVLMKPDPNAATFTLANLQAADNPLNQKELGDRTPLSYEWETVSPTSDPIVVALQAGNSITFTPNTSSDFTGVGSRPLSVSFSGMINSEKNLAKASAGDWGQWVSSGVTHQQGQFGFNTAQVILKGNRPLRMDFPADPDTGSRTRVLFFGLLLQNQQEVQLAWSKTEQTNITYNYQAAPLDKLFNNQVTTYTYNVFS
jgi:hypothetical protein